MRACSSLASGFVHTLQSTKARLGRGSPRTGRSLRPRTRRRPRPRTRSLRVYWSLCLECRGTKQQCCTGIWRATRRSGAWSRTPSTPRALARWGCDSSLRPRARVSVREEVPTVVTTTTRARLGSGSSLYNAASHREREADSAVLPIGWVADRAIDTVQRNIVRLLNLLITDPLATTPPEGGETLPCFQITAPTHSRIVWWYSASSVTHAKGASPSETNAS